MQKIFTSKATDQLRNTSAKKTCLLSTVPFDMGFTRVNWSYTEAGHGKGVPDGVGGVVKREADRLVMHQNDVTGAESLFRLLSNKLGCKYKDVFRLRTRCRLVQQTS